MVTKALQQKYLFIVLIIMFVPLIAYSQDNTLYYLQGVPQRYFTNPASQPECNFFLGAPGLSSTMLNYSTKGFTSDQFMVKDPETDSIYRFYQRPDLYGNFISGLNKVNYISANEADNLISLGFRANKMYFTLDYGFKLNEQLSFPKELLYFIPFNVEDGANYNLSSLNINFTSYSELALGISRQFNEQLSIGIRPKMLFGLATINTSGTDINIDTRLREWDITAKTDLNVCVPWVDLPVDENGIIQIKDGIKTDTTLYTEYDYLKMSLKNKGLGIDIGINYKPYRRLELSASLIDLGYIKWTNKPNTVSLNGNYKWEGVQSNSADTIKFWDYISDTLKSSFKVTGSNQSFTTYLTSKVMFGGRFFLTPSFDLGAITRFDFFKDEIASNIILLANWRPSTILGISASYGLLDGSYSTFGLGFTSHIGPFNLYIITDDIVSDGSYKEFPTGNSTIPLFKNMNSYNIRFGLNLVFGNNKVKMLMKDKPMYYSTDY
jgi:hypothetical protein